MQVCPQILVTKNFGLKRKSDILNFPKFKDFYETNYSHGTYYFHVFKCNSSACPYHNELRGEPKKTFPDPIPYKDSSEVEHYKEGKDAREILTK